MKTLRLVSLFLLSILAFSGCDKIDPPYKKPIIIPAGERKVLVEDYTGHKCGYCPRASRAAYQLKQTYGDRMIVIAVHAGFFAGTSVPPYTYDFKCPESIALDNDFGISLAGNPNGMVNRRFVSNSYIIPYTSWSTEVAKVLNDTLPLPVSINVTTTYDSTSRNLDATVKMDFASTLEGTYKLCTYMVEDSIVEWQKDYDTPSPSDVQNYIHREVLRGSMTGTYGEVIANTKEGDTETRTHNITLNTAWNARNMSLVVFLFNEATKEIVQVEQKHLY